MLFRSVFLGNDGQIARLLFARRYFAGRFCAFCGEIPSFSAQNRIFLRFLCIAERVAGHGVNGNSVINAAVILSVEYCRNL